MRNRTPRSPRAAILIPPNPSRPMAGLLAEGGADVLCLAGVLDCSWVHVQHSVPTLQFTFLGCVVILATLISMLHFILTCNGNTHVGFHWVSPGPFPDHPALQSAPFRARPLLYVHVDSFRRHCFRKNSNLQTCLNHVNRLYAICSEILGTEQV